MEMVRAKDGVVSAGAKLVWRRQRILWWVYAVNLLLALMATLPVAATLGRVLNRSLAAERLYKGFDLAVLIELLHQPGVSVRAQVPGSFLFSLIFFLFMLFLTGGVLETYHLDRAISTGDFFQACGAFFWRFVRLLVILLILLAPIALAFARVLRWAGRLSSDAPQAALGFWVGVSGMMVTLFLLMAVRLWFDMAQVCAVGENESAMRRTLVRGFKLVFGNFASLLWICLRILLVAVVGLALALIVWIKFVRPEWVAVSFLFGQGVILVWLAARLWLRASEMVWYLRRDPALSPDYLDKLVA
jgi:hypothetical protein